MKKQFYITEVFAERPYGGNQLGTLLDAGDVGTGVMQQVARGFNFSETTFFCGGNLESGFDVRIFTPTAELPFAGHPTLGSAFLAKHLFCDASVDRLELNLGVGKIPVTFGQDDVLWMRQKEPEFGGQVERARVARVLGLEPEDILADFPCQYVSTGLEFLIVPIRSLDRLQAIRITADDFGHGLLAFCPEGYEDGQAIAARMFAADFGVKEDPATGSANGSLASYLVEHSFFGGTHVELSVGQGYEIERPSQLYLDARKDHAGFEINVGGKVRIVASGEWYV
jgi:trans-2,3-dihydro-3-hydroxyanthranilate isomerase